MPNVELELSSTLLSDTIIVGEQIRMWTTIRNVGQQDAVLSDGSQGSALSYELRCSDDAQLIDTYSSLDDWAERNPLQAETQITPQRVIAPATSSMSTEEVRVFNLPAGNYQLRAVLRVGGQFFASPSAALTIRSPKPQCFLRGYYQGSDRFWSVLGHEENGQTKISVQESLSNRPDDGSYTRIAAWAGGTVDGFSVSHPCSASVAANSQGSWVAWVSEQHFYVCFLAQGELSKEPEPTYLGDGYYRLLESGSQTQQNEGLFYLVDCEKNQLIQFRCGAAEITRSDIPAPWGEGADLESLTAMPARGGIPGHLVWRQKHAGESCILAVALPENPTREKSEALCLFRSSEELVAFSSPVFDEQEGVSLSVLWQRGDDDGSTVLETFSSSETESTRPGRLELSPPVPDVRAWHIGVEHAQDRVTLVAAQTEKGIWIRELDSDDSWLELDCDIDPKRIFCHRNTDGEFWISAFDGVAGCTSLLLDIAPQEDIDMDSDDALPSEDVDAEDGDEDDQPLTDEQEAAEEVDTLFELARREIEAEEELE